MWMGGGLGSIVAAAAAGVVCEQVAAVGDDQHAIKRAMDGEGAVAAIEQDQWCRDARPDIDGVTRKATRGSSKPLLPIKQSGDPTGRP